jgi:UDP-N-acetylglucosamine--N-acetylmuramyl-(pentapeptide) pyrophosphoryl-undecaprenol N-acetylglucosamine transferase
LAFGTMQAWALLRRIRPDAVIGFGGYASVPTMLAAGFSGCATALHEQNAVLGRANRVLARRVERVATSFEDCAALPSGIRGKVSHTGMPVRPEVAAMRDQPYPPLLAEGPANLLILGGSQGAHVFAEVIPKALALLPGAWRRRWQIAQQCRPEDAEEARAAYRELDIEAEISPFFDDVPERLAAAHLLIARAGASTVAEVTTVGRPALLVPYPFAVDDHQSANAHAIDEVGAGWLMPQDDFTPTKVAARLEALFSLPVTLEKAAACARAAGRPDAAVRLADLVCELLPNGDAQGGPGTTTREAA